MQSDAATYSLDVFVYRHAIPSTSSIMKNEICYYALLHPLGDS